MRLHLTSSEPAPRTRPIAAAFWAAEQKPATYVAYGWYTRLAGFAWDTGKAKRNLAKHRVSFDDAATVFDDELFVVFADPDHSIEESRSSSWAALSGGVCW